MFNLLHRSTSQELFKKGLCNHIFHYVKLGGSHRVLYHQINVFAVSKDEWNTLVSP